MKFLNSSISLLLIIICISCNSKKQMDTSRSTLEFSTHDFQQVNNSRMENATELNLPQDQYLTATIHLAAPLIHTLRTLDSTASDESLLANGNFRISFFVDGKEIFSKNIVPGAGLPQAKMESLQHRVPLIYPESIDYWGYYLWLEFSKVRGGDQALSDGEHSLLLKVNAYHKGDTLRYSPTLATGSISVKVNPIPVDPKAIAVQTIAPLSDWEISKDSFNHRLIEQLNTKIAQQKFENITSIVVIKNNALLLEEYFNGADRSSLHDTRSVGKTFASTVLGIAIDEGFIADENKVLGDYYDLKNFKNYHPDKEKISLKSLLTMSSGFEGNDDDYGSLGNEENMYPTDNWVKFTLDLPLDTTKTMGIDYQYFTAGVVLLGDILEQNVPGGLVRYADKKLFGPLQITDYQWQYTPQKVGNTAGGLQMRSIDYAKYGQLYKNKGIWQGKRILSASWVEKSTNKHVRQPYGDGHYYGYLLWNKQYTVKGKKYEVSFCSGNGGNKIISVKDLPLVIVITAQAYNLPYAHTQVDTMMEDYLLPALLP